VALVETLGGTRVEYVGKPEDSLMVMADPDGNEFCVNHRLLDSLTSRGDE